MLTLRTARLVSRPACLADASALFDVYACDPAVARYMTWRSHRDASETEAFLAPVIASMARGEVSLLVLSEASRPEMPIGVFEARYSAHRVDIGYALGRTYWNRGLMTEELRAAIAWARATGRFRRVWAVCDVDNHASARVMQKAGMDFEGILRRWFVHPNIDDAPRDCACYAAAW